MLTGHSALDKEPISLNGVRKRATINWPGPGGENETGLDCHTAVATLIVTALWPKYWMWNMADGLCCGATPQFGTWPGGY
jgi:hypothetical protein